MIRKGDVLRRKQDGNEHQVLATVEGLYAISQPAERGYVWMWFTEEKLTEEFDLPKEKWMPSDGEKYWCLTMENFGMYKEYVWGKKRVFDEWNMNFGNCFRTREEAEAKAQEIRRILQA